MSVQSDQAERDYHYETELHPFAHIVTASFPAERWSAIFYSWMSLKAYLLGVHAVENVRLYATESDEGRVRATFVVVFSTREAVAAWVESGYPVEEMLAANGVGESDINSVLARDLS
jgi:hypothetical protein